MWEQEVSPTEEERAKVKVGAEHELYMFISFLIISHAFSCLFMLSPWVFHGFSTSFHPVESCFTLF